MAIQNGRGITSLPYYPDSYEPGVPFGPGRDVPYSNPFLPQISTITLSATADVSDEIVAGQVWEIVLTDPSGVEYSTEYTVTADDNTAGTDGAGLAYMAGRLASALEGNAELSNIISATSSGAVITITWLHADQGAWTVSATCTPAAAEAVLTDTVATSQTAGGVVIPMARFVRYGTVVQGMRRASLPSAATDVIAGVALRDMTRTRLYDTLATAVDSYAIGDMVSVREQGAVPMRNVGDAAAVPGGPVYCVVSTSGGDALGEARNDRDGTADVWTLTPTVANSTIYAIQIVLPEWDGLPAVVRTYEYTSDGSAADTEIVADFVSQINGDSVISGRVTASGTTTLIITGDVLGMPILVQDAASAGDWASITHTTTAAAYTVLVPRARWDEPCAPEAVAPIFLNT